MRQRQRALTRGVLALVCLAWLQAAIVPCVMAHSGAAVAEPAPAVADLHPGHAGHGGHDHAAATGQSGRAESEHPCLYCPPHDGDGRSCEGAGDCAYPHEPQVDARAAAALPAALPVAFVVPLPRPATRKVLDEPDAAEAVPRVSLAVSYCRFIE